MIISSRSRLVVSVQGEQYLRHTITDPLPGGLSLEETLTGGGGMGW